MTKTHLTVADVVKLLGRKVGAYDTQNEAAAAFGIEPSELSRILNKKRPPSRAICAKLGLEPTTIYLWLPK